MPLGKSEDGTDLLDTVTIYETEQPQNLLVGPPGDRRIITVPVAMPASAAFPGPVVDPRAPDQTVLLYESKSFAQVARLRTPVVAEVVATPPPVAPRAVPISTSVMRLRPPLFAPGITTPPPRPLAVTQVLPPPPPRMIDVVPPVLRSTTPAGTFVAPVPPLTATRSRAVIPTAPPLYPAYEFSQPVDDGWYGLGVFTDDGVGTPDGGVPDGGVPTSPPIPDAGPIVTMGSLVVNPTSLDLGSSAKGTMSVAKKITVTNTSKQTSGTMSFSFVSGDAALFAMENSTCPGQFDAGGSCDLFISFTPTSAKALTTTLRIKGSVAGTTDVPLQALGIASKLTVNLTEHDFGNVMLGSTGVIVLTYTNEGNDTTQGQTYYGSGSAGAAYDVTDGCNGLDMKPGERCNVSVKYKPTEIGVTSLLVEMRTSRDNSSAFTTLVGTGIP